MAKPTSAAREEMIRLRRMHGVISNYAAERLHSTLTLLGDDRHISKSRLDRVDLAITSLRAEPMDVTFNRISGNALVGGNGLIALRGFRKSLVDRLMAFGIPVLDHDFHPHISLAYVAYQERNIPITPVHWTIEEILLIRSVHGRGHDTLRRWPLIRRQGGFGF
jgi:2'-5' RNA ligase